MEGGSQGGQLVQWPHGCFDSLLPGPAGERCLYLAPTFSLDKDKSIPGPARHAGLCSRHQAALLPTPVNYSHCMHFPPDNEVERLRRHPHVHGAGFSSLEEDWDFRSRWEQWAVGVWGTNCTRQLTGFQDRVLAHFCCFPTVLQGSRRKEDRHKCLWTQAALAQQP